MPSASFAASLRVEAPSTTVLVGDTVSLDFILSDVQDLFGAGLNFEYNPQFLRYLGAEEGSFLNGGGANSTIFLVTDNPMDGRVLAGVTRSHYTDGGASTSGDTLLMSMEFVILEADSIPLAIIRSSLIAPDGTTKYPHTVQNSYLIPESPTSVMDQGWDDMLPGRMTLGECYPNPFNPSTRIDCRLARAGHVCVEVRNVLGQLVTTLFNGPLSRGTHTFGWSVGSQRAHSASSGIYFFRVHTSEGIQSRKAIYCK